MQKWQLALSSFKYLYIISNFHCHRHVWGNQVTFWNNMKSIWNNVHCYLIKCAIAEMVQATSLLISDISLLFQFNFKANNSAIHFLFYLLLTASQSDVQRFRYIGCYQYQWRWYDRVVMYLQNFRKYSDDYIFGIYGLHQ